MTGRNDGAAGDGPDFICIGMQKAGTHWLFDQLQQHPDFWMPVIKEVQYFNFGRREYPTKSVRTELGHFRSGPEAYGRRLKVKGLRPATERDDRFFDLLEASFGTRNDTDVYAGLFAPKGELISGDISPAYSALDGELVEAIARRLPRAKIVLMLRDPVERFASAVSAGVSKGVVPPDVLSSTAAFGRYTASGNALRMGLPSRTAELWRRHFENFRFYFLEDVAADPDAVRRDVLTYLGGDPDKPSGTLAAGHNRKAGQRQHDFSPEVRRAAAELFLPELERSAAMFGGRAEGWLERHRAFAAG